MYVDYYDFQTDPFRIEPDYRFFYESRQHRNALDVLSKGLSTGDGIGVVTGEHGVGKSTLLDFVNAHLEPSHFVTARIVATGLEPEQLLPELARQFDIDVEGSGDTEISERLEAFLSESRLAQRRVILLVDESQDLATGCLEALLRLSNLHAGDRRGLHIAFFGGLQTKRILDSGDVSRLRLNVVQSCQVLPLEIEDTRGLIIHRLRRVGWLGDPGFAEGAVELIHLRTGGLPRSIILLCEALLQHSCRHRLHQIGSDVVSRVGLEMQREWLKANRLAPTGEAAAPSITVPTPRPERSVSPPARYAAEASAAKPGPDRTPLRHEILTVAGAVLGVVGFAFIAWSFRPVPVAIPTTPPGETELASTRDGVQAGTSRWIRGRTASRGKETSFAAAETRPPDPAPPRPDTARSRASSIAAATKLEAIPAPPPAPTLPELEDDTVPEAQGARSDPARALVEQLPAKPTAARADTGSFLGRAAARQAQAAAALTAATQAQAPERSRKPSVLLEEQLSFLPSPADPAPSKPTAAVVANIDPKTTLSSAEIDPKTALSVVDMVLTRGVVDREPLDTRRDFSSTDGKATAFLRLSNPGRPSKVSVHWYIDERLHSTVELKVGTSGQWRTWSSAQIQPGAWRVRVEDEARRVLVERAFEVR